MRSPSDPRIAIVGGGLAGLVAAWRLAQRGLHDVDVFEARAMPGGRILSTDPSGQPVNPARPEADRFDLGPTWFWPAVQTQLDELVSELGLERFPQHEEGDLLIERSPHEPAMRVRGYASEPPSMRLVGGTGALIAALMTRLERTRIHTGQTVRELGRGDRHIELILDDVNGHTTTRQASQVLLALPPRLAATRLKFEPALPEPLAREWQATPTWMAPHAKYVAIYDRPFWREQGLCGGARSNVGPMVEMHDVSMPGGHAALFGFLGVPATVRREIGEDALRVHCRAQLTRLFGERAARPVGDACKDWAVDPLTAIPLDHNASGQHAPAPASRAMAGVWEGVLIGIGSEWSPQFPGYLAGAVDAAERGVRQCLAHLDLPTQETRP